VTAVLAYTGIIIGLTVLLYLPLFLLNISMRYNEIVEAVELSGLLGKVNRTIYNTVEQVVERIVREFTARAIHDRRAKLGYHPYQDVAKGYKTFDPEEWERANKDWGVESDGIGDNLSDWLPTDLSQSQRHEVYALMSTLGRALTTDVQEFVKARFGDLVYLQGGQLERHTKDIYTEIWWRPKDDLNYRGAYYANSAHANGNRTLIYVVADRNQWAEWLRDEVGNYISGEGTNYEKFSKSIINTFIHEYQHLEQDIKGSKGQLGLIPRGKRRNINVWWEEAYDYYLGKVKEIDSHATGAAAEVVNNIINDKSRYGARWDKNWTADKIQTEDWNDAIKDAIQDAGYLSIPEKEYQKYIIGLNRQYSEKIDPRIKEKFLTKVRQRFIKTYINRLSSYLRPETNQTLKGPRGQLPESN
jgi:hypothetical protein